MSRELFVWVESHTVVPDFEHEQLTAYRKAQVHLCGTCMLHGVVERFLPDAVEHLFHADRNIRLLAQAGIDLDGMAGHECRHLFLEGSDDTFGLE